MTQEKPSKNIPSILIGILCIAIAVRLACFFYYQAHAGIETFEYETVAENLLYGNGFQMEIHHTIQKAPIAPVFPALCAFIYMLFGHYHPLIIFLQILMNAAVCYMIFLLTKRFFGLQQAYLAALLTALHPGLIIYSATKLHSLSFYSFLICSAVYLFTDLLSATNTKKKIILGIITGVCVLERATFLPFFVLAWIWLYYNSPKKKEAAKTILISLISLIIIVSPWMIRNTLIFKRCVFIQTNQWWGFWAGNNPQSSGTLYMPSGINAIEASPREFQEKLMRLDEIGQMDLFKSASLAFVRQHPGQFMLLTVKKFFYFWWFSPQAGILYPALYLTWYKIYYSFILIFALIGLLQSVWKKESRSITILILLLFISNSLVHSLYYLEGRHRWSLEPLLLIFFAHGCITLLHKCKTALFT
ncbi:MAG TPA: glycosyltransferase family 39 protein [Candidatus Omnitrophota bacterium]|nr:glycosyltransferase family 39 protein [Candidatus Omnitrophota bacterium]